MKKGKPTIGDYIETVDCWGERREGYVTDLLNKQFIFRETINAIPQYLFYTDTWRTR
jgi:hypothetical protein